MSYSGAMPSYILPSIEDVIAVYFADFKILFDCVSTTVTEAILGLILGTLVAFILAFLIDRFNRVRKMLYPLLVITQSIPVVAIAPLVVLLFGYDMRPKIFLTALCCFFPITVSLYNGFKSPDKQYFDLFKTMGASNFQVFRFVKLPFAVPHFVSGLKIATSYALISALLAEWVGGNSGLGVYMIRAKNSYAFDKLFAVIILICVVSVVLVKAIDAANSMVLSKLHFNIVENNNG